MLTNKFILFSFFVFVTYENVSCSYDIVYTDRHTHLNQFDGSVGQNACIHSISCVRVYISYDLVAFSDSKIKQSILHIYMYISRMCMFNSFGFSMKLLWLFDHCRNHRRLAYHRRYYAQKSKWKINSNRMRWHKLFKSYCIIIVEQFPFIFIYRRDKTKASENIMCWDIRLSNALNAQQSRKVEREREWNKAVPV